MNRLRFAILRFAFLAAFTIARSISAVDNWETDFARRRDALLTTPVSEKNFVGFVEHYLKLTLGDIGPSEENGRVYFTISTDAVSVAVSYYCDKSEVRTQRVAKLMEEWFDTILRNVDGYLNPNLIRQDLEAELENVMSRPADSVMLRDSKRRICDEVARKMRLQAHQSVVPGIAAAFFRILEPFYEATDKGFRIKVLDNKYVGEKFAPYPGARR